MARRKPREHGVIFGRGDELDAGVEEPPMAVAPFGFGTGIPVYTGAPIPFGDPPPEPVKLVGDVPWELREDAGSKTDAPPEAGT
jgi:hypothetical protein